MHVVIQRASLGTISIGQNNDYYGSYTAVGAQLVSVANAQPGDIIQIYNVANHQATGHEHTAIILGRDSSKAFYVVDQNYIHALQVGYHHNYDPSANLASGWAVAIWRLGTNTPAPSISKVTPSYGAVDAFVTITGSNLSGATGISFAGISSTGPVSAAVVNDSATQVGTVVPVGAVTGNLSVTTPAGTATVSFFVIQNPSPTIVGVSGNEDAYTIDSTGHLWQTFFSPGGTSWSGWIPLGTPVGHTLVGRPTAWVSPVTGNEEVFARDTAGNYWQTFFPPGGSSWQGWNQVGATSGPNFTSDPTILRGISGNEEVFGVDSTGHLRQTFFSPGGTSWSGWIPLGDPSVAPSITSANSAHFTKGVAGTFKVTASDSPSPTLGESGALDGLNFDTSSGILSGTPTAAGTYPITFTASNGVGSPATQSFTLKVLGFHITTTMLPRGKRGIAYSTRLAALGGVTPFAWKALTSLPKGLKLSTTGVLSGTPAKTLTAMTYTFSVQVTDSTQPKHQVVKATVTVALR